MHSKRLLRFSLRRFSSTCAAEREPRARFQIGLESRASQMPECLSPRTQFIDLAEINLLSRGLMRQNHGCRTHKYCSCQADNPHSITSSARPRSETGTVMPSTFAVFSLMSLAQPTQQEAEVNGDGRERGYYSDEQNCESEMLAHDCIVLAGTRSITPSSVASLARYARATCTTSWPRRDDG